MKAPNTLADYGFEPGCQCSLSVGRRISHCDFSNGDSSCPVLLLACPLYGASASGLSFSGCLFYVLTTLLNG